MTPPAASPGCKLIVALDTPRPQTALALAGDLKGAVDWLKVGLELFTATGPSVVRDLSRLGFNIFLDLKFFDIPNTVAGAVQNAAGLGAGLATLHAMGGERMAHAALEARERAGARDLRLVAVTVLTSMDAADLAHLGDPGARPQPAGLVARLAKAAKAWGLDGVVCSPWEAAAVKESHGADFLAVTPGIRLAVSADDDQRRAATPAQAAAAGADFVVAGRPVTASADPRMSALDIVSQLATY